MTILPPLTGTPLDYPIHAPADGHVPDHDVDRKGHKRGSPKYRPWNDPDHWFVFRPRPLRRAAIAASIAGVSVALFILAPVVFIGAVAIAFISGCVWGTDKLIKAIDSHDET
ncbi:hypothetical protein HJB67_12915 [Rhizobium lentis]|uniref:hypothetical protein n=1 Tax=Rhizobium lentis TaxID=1138194 RepID=UPI001C82D1CD|nr:hypothetical protein [Rhizobium lentis]MBX5010856.1 hypothetical protein [Rhizobium lentis]